MRVKLLELGKPTSNGHIYLEENCKILENGLVYDGYKYTDDPADIIGIFENCHVEDNCIVADIIFSNTLKGKWMKSFGDSLIIAPSGVGIIKDDGLVVEYIMTSINCI